MERIKNVQDSRGADSQYRQPFATASAVAPTTAVTTIHCPRIGCRHAVTADSEQWAIAKLQAHLLSPAHVGAGARS